MMIIQKSTLNETIRRILEKQIFQKFIDLFYEKNSDIALPKETLKSFIDELFVEVNITVDDKIILKVVAPGFENIGSPYHIGDDGLKDLIRETLDKIIGTDIVQYEGLIEIQHKN